MQVRDIDILLQRYTAAEHRIGANLQELEQHSVYQLLKTGVLTGKTQQALAGTATSAPDLWQLLLRLGSALEQARRMRGTNATMGGKARRELADYLLADSVLLTTEDIPLAQRGLTSASTRDQYISIEALIARMSALYEPVREVVTHAEAVLRDLLPRLNSAEATLTRLQADAHALNMDSVELDRIEETIARVRDLSLTDPLAIPVNTRESFDQAIHDAGAVIAAARTSHDELASDLAKASDLLDSCRSLIAQATTNRRDSLAKIARPVGLRQPPSVAAIDGERGLAKKLDPIATSTDPWQAVRRRLDVWTATASRLQDQLAGVVAANARPLEARDELRGRLAAFRAKMAATGFSEDLVLRDISAEAHNELFTSPTDLGRAEKLVTEFGNRLAQP